MKSRGKIQSNFADVHLLQAWDPWLRYVDDFHFETGAGEPLLNPYFPDMVRHLRKRYPWMKLSVTTNGLLIDSELRQVMVEQGFNRVSVSLHGGTPEVYEILQGGDFGRVTGNLRELVRLRAKKGVSYPSVGINFALNKLNAHSLKDLIRLSRDIKLDEILVYHYYHARNLLDKEVSFFFDAKECNMILEEAYREAKHLGVKLVPEEPPYLSATEIESASGDSGKSCSLPWTGIQFPPCHEEESFHYVGVCNRIDLLKLNFTRWGKCFDFKSIWLHPYLQYLRRTVNAKGRNPICRFCQDRTTPTVRRVDNVEYSRRRDRAVREFFEEASANGFVAPASDDVRPLDRNPYEYEDGEWPPR